MNSQMLIQYEVRCCWPNTFPIFNYAIVFRNGVDFYESIHDKACDSDWACSDAMIYSFTGIKPIPDSLYVNWLSIYEKKQYCIETEIPAEEIAYLFSVIDETNKDKLFEFLIVGIAPLGSIALWIAGRKKSRKLLWLKAKNTIIDFSVFFPNHPNLTFSQISKEYGITPNSRLDKTLFDKYMQQFTYRYLLLFEHWKKDQEEWMMYSDKEIIPELDYIEEALFDGTHDKLHDGGLMNYHEAGKPKRLAVKWHIKKSEYTAYFWFVDEEIRSAFDSFYSAHPETKTDFMIRIDSEKNKYELTLFCDGIKEPLLISESAYQLLVFKNKFEYFRSKNYDQPRGAWIW